jgi:tetratricopeptide (TPR) repeat protein
LFDLRKYLRNYVEAGKEAASAAEIGVCIAEDVLGEEIFLKLWDADTRRSLVIQLPAATEEDNRLAAALARVPWEIARPAASQPMLGERNLVVRVIHLMAAPTNEPLALDADEDLRVLFVFAEARGSRPLAVRQERLELRRLFEKKIYPKRRVVAHFLSHGVTGERLEGQIRDNGGYHVVHWSGHGHMNLLELAKPGGESDHLSGKELLELFTKAGGYIPHLVFLSACHSGDILRVKDWKDFLAVAEGKEPGAKDAAAPETKDIPLAEEPGYTGTAHALLAGGVPSVVAMRYAVGDDYARALGVEFYRATLEYERPQTVAEALTTARKLLRDPKRADRARFEVCDHATPVLYGAEKLGLTLRKGPSSDLNPRDPRLHRIAELTMASHENFVGRTWELADLGADFIGAAGGPAINPIAVITGLGGMGKTALTAEALSLWEQNFQWVLLYQAKPNALNFENTLRDIHVKLKGELGGYHKYVQANQAAAIYRETTAEFTGKQRLERLMFNLVRALKAEPILLVLDNFEKCLKPQAKPASSGDDPLWACQDPAWDECLELLATELVGWPSRVLITSRFPLAALADKTYCSVRLGPLLPGDAALYLRGHAGLSKMVFGGDKVECELAKRLLAASRFHPLEMDRLARLATGGKALREQFLKALTTLESKTGYGQLPALFATTTGDTRELELEYLNDALGTSIDQLIEGASPDARRLLWIIGLANDPVSLGLLRKVWGGKSVAQAAAGTIPARPNLTPLLRYLVAVGLATEERGGPANANPNLTCHELVCERIREWMEKRPVDRGDLRENAIRLAYATWFEAAFDELRNSDVALAIEAGRRAVVYYAEAGDYDGLSRCAAAVVLHASADPAVLDGLLPHLQAANSLPNAKARWNCLLGVADALDNTGRTHDSRPFYREAAVLARTVAEAGGSDAGQAWRDYGTITGNWAVALRNISNLEGARKLQLESIKAKKKGGAPAIFIIAGELEVLNIDAMLGEDDHALQRINEIILQLEEWWRRSRAGEFLPQAPHPQLAATLIHALDIASRINASEEEWEPALNRADAIVALKRALKYSPENIGVDQLTRAFCLTELERYTEAKTELDHCLNVFKNNTSFKAKTYSYLAVLFNKLGDIPQAILQGRRALATLGNSESIGDRGAAHYNLARGLGSSTNAHELAEAREHEVAALIYAALTEQGQHYEASLRAYQTAFRDAQTAGIKLATPRLAELLALPAFRSLRDWLAANGVDTEKLQTDIDQLLEQVRQMVATSEQTQGPT